LARLKSCPDGLSLALLSDGLFLALRKSCPDERKKLSSVF
jgi:hypothetical protein